jgi:TPR repeat protein
MPAVPENMQHNLAHLEQQAHRPGPYDYNNYQAQHHASNINYQNQTYPNDGQPQAQYNGGGLNHNQPNYGQAVPFEPTEQPTFSRFPILRNPPPNVPPTAEQKEASLEAARLPVLSSNDPLNQLDWAQDALAYVEEAITNEQRISGTPAAAVKLPRVQQLLKDDAMKVILFLADQEHPRALVLKGMWLEFGKFDHGIDKRQAWECYKTAVRNAVGLNPDDPAKKWGGRAQYRIGMQFENSKDINNALKHYHMGVNEGDSAACYRLGMMVLLGQHGQAQDFQRGLTLIYAAAKNADENAPQGAYVLGMLQARELPQVSIPDRFLAKNINQARINIERAAFLGFAKAQVKMGAAYELGELGCGFNPALSLHYNSLAARQGEVDAEMAISKWFLAGHDGVFEKDEEMAFTYAERAAQDGLPNAQFAMGYFHEIGIYVPVNLLVAREWYAKAAANGNGDAANRIDSLSRSKTLSRKDHERIALSKIKESRLQSPTESAPPLPPMPAMIDMPDPSRLSLHSPTLSAADGHQQRRQSGAPYPAGGDFGSPRPGLNNQPSNPEFRPGSAFGINPNLRPSSAATIAGTRPDQQVRPALQDQGRPYSNYDGTAPGYGRGGRAVSGPPPRGHAGPGRGAPPVQDQMAPQPPQKVDIGYLAPLDSTGRDRKKRPQGSDSPNLGRPVQNASSNTQSNQRQPRPTAPQMSPNLSNTQRPGRTEPPPQKPVPQQSRPQPSGPSKPPPVAAQKPAPSFVKPAAATRPPPNPGKGPKTFEEMGVPAGKGKDECVSLATGFEESLY